MKNDYYVYEHIRLDNNTCFYVGKGKGRRAWTKTRNKHHDRIVSKYGMKVNIIKDSLTEEEALNLEKEVIARYLNDGYGIDIIGMRGSNENKILTNCTLGGEGGFGMKHSDNWREQHSKRMFGENNPAYGVNYWALRSNEENEQLRKNYSQRATGINNSMYGISPKERMNEKTYKHWREKQFINNSGERNPNYGNDTLYKKLLSNPELKIQYYSRPASQNGRARRIYVYSSNGEFLEYFDYIGACAEWLKEKLELKTKINTIRCNIITSITKNKLYRGYKFSYEKI